MKKVSLSLRQVSDLDEPTKKFPLWRCGLAILASVTHSSSPTTVTLWSPNNLVSRAAHISLAKDISWASYELAPSPRTRFEVPVSIVSLCHAHTPRRCSIFASYCDAHVSRHVTELINEQCPPLLSESIMALLMKFSLSSIMSYRISFIRSAHNRFISIVLVLFFLQAVAAAQKTCAQSSEAGGGLGGSWPKFKREWHNIYDMYNCNCLKKVMF